jgi:hypothetical protein
MKIEIFSYMAHCRVENINESKQHHIPEDLNVLQHRLENRKTRSMMSN